MSSVVNTSSITPLSVVFDHNPNSTANREFKFKNIASPSKDDAATHAKLTLIDGELDGGSAELAALTDGRCRATKTNRARMFTSGPEAPAAASAWTSRHRSRSRRSTATRGTQTRVVHSCTNSTQRTDPIRNSIPIRNVVSIRRLVAGN